MSVKHALLALLEQEPMYGYQLRVAFEERTAGTWPLNIGQVYTTLSRLERDGLVTAGETDSDGHQLYRLTAAGRAEVTAWFGSAVPRTQPARDELAIKLALGVSARDLDLADIIQRQRSATMKALQDYNRLKRKATDLGHELVLDSLIFAAEAEIRWLDHCEAQLRRTADRAVR
ncbi:DNA-binding transcriptional regulator, PadR family [Nocardioides terrae]|uniref:DNA-binding transcriptional regulator, PadR family n=1 Tax=Nocardioides terrae TaxID=574651 RepID=A0A1I1GP46_9ACTN|nr:PadR family transcriptional regulator [Nocardioides terrae]SFC13527.1 DNA-binding transcriptional regulator, PadR family [Nocardioides terrae]